ncbi:hypothetical protein D2962_16225 [Biomaibacter acetigenes]|uniref:Uncharacterized protein n=1 Tax=Biomaibacter acetigenes TaxID=2316383 RepID=A0A3G2R8X4_9FIRM|nr:hypothetical protein [Biomaibacter acetigenes]AYO31942.1 hypothetical protein D2962_16225 [Biomaibacter acetigenes]
MNSDFVEKQIEQVERSVRIYLKRKEKKGTNFKTKPEVLSGLMTLSYFGILFKSLLKGDTWNFKSEEKEINEMVDFFLKEFIN